MKPFTFVIASAIAFLLVATPASAATGAITIVEDSVGGDASFNFSSNFGLSSLTTVNGVATQTFTGLTAGASYSLTENASVNWTQTSAVCTNGTPSAIGVLPGVTTVCTITNTAQAALPGSITIVKHAVGGDGTFGFTSNFGLTSLTTVNGTATQTVTGLTAGATFTLAENAAAGWTQTAAVCTNGTPDAIIVLAGASTTCTITNTKGAAGTGSITIVENSVGGDGAFAFSSNFGLNSLTTVNGTATQTFTGLTAGGSYGLTANASPNWTATSAVCTNGAPSAIGVLAGVTTVCTITNTAVPACPATGATVSLDMLSQLGNLGNTHTYFVNGTALTAYGFNNDGTPTALYAKNEGPTEAGLGIASDSDFEVNSSTFIQLDVSALTAAGFTNAQVLLNSVQPPDTWEIYGSNTLGTLGTRLTGPDTTALTLIAMPGYGSYKYIGVRAAVGNIELGGLAFTAPAPSCSPLPSPGSITVIKHAVGGDGTFAFTSNFGLSSITTVGGTATQTLTGLTAGATFTLSENAAAGWTQTAATCTGGTLAAIVVLPGATTTCTITNTKVAANVGSITIVKNSVGGDGTFSFSTNFGLSSLTTVNGTATQTFTGLTAGGNFALTENLSASWTQTSAVCTNGTLSAIGVVAGVTTVCTITNTAVPACPGTGATVSLDMLSPLGNLGNTHTYSVNGTSLTAYGFNTDGTPTALYAKNEGPTEKGLGIASDSDFEINSTSFIQLDVSALTAAGFTNAQILLNSVQAPDTWEIYGSNTLGTLGTRLTGPDGTGLVLVAMPGYGTYKYIGVHAAVGNVEIGGLAFAAPAVACPPPPAAGSITIVKNAVGGNGTFSFSSNFGLTSLTTLNGTATQTITGLTAGSNFTLTENVTAGWTQTAAVCTNGTLAGIVVLAGATTTCTITNTVVPPVGPGSGGSGPGTGSTATADLTVAKSHVGNLRQGESGDYTITVSNVGQAATTGTVTVTDQLPAGLIAASVAGSGWTCFPGNLSCSRSDALAPGASYPPVTVTVNVAANGQLFNQSTGTPAFLGGDLFISMADGTVQWRRADWSLVKSIATSTTGQSKGAAFDAAGNLYITHWYGDTATGNDVEKFDSSGNYLGQFGTGYNCNPSSIVFDATGNAFVGQADCGAQIVKLDPSGHATDQMSVAVENRGTYDVALGSDQCTMYYTSEGPDVKRYDVCVKTQLPNFNTAPLPDPVAGAMALLPDGGMLVADSSVIAHLDASGKLLGTFDTPSDNCWLGVALASDAASFWASDWCSSSVVHFDIATGNVLAAEVANPAGFMVKRIAIRPNTFNLDVTNVATVSGGGEINVSNNSASDLTTIAPPLTGSLPTGTFAVLINAASSTPTVAPGSIAAVFGKGLAVSQDVAASVPLPGTLAGSSIQLGGHTAPLFYASPGQLNIQIPWEMSGQTDVAMSANTGAGASMQQMVKIVPFAPGIFTLNGSGSGQAVALIAGTTRLASPASVASGLPASKGGYISLYCTGLGSVTNQPSTGSSADSSGTLSWTNTRPTVTIGGLPADVSFSGLAPGLVGVYQVNVKVPLDVATGDAIPLTLSIGGVTSNTVSLAVQ